MDSFALLPWQERALSTPLDCDLVLAGGRGGGKSYCLAALIVQLVTLVPGARVLVLRRTFPGLTDFQSLSMSLFPLADSGARYASQSHVWKFSNGATVELGILDNEVDFQRYQGRSFGFIGLDEGGQWNDFKLIDLMRSCLRSPGSPVRMVIACNPGGPLHGALYRRYISRATPWTPCDDILTGRPFIVIPSTFTDNSHLDSDSYAAQLKAATAGDPELLRAWLVGDWAIARGSYFGSVLEESRVMIEPWDRLPIYASGMEKATNHERRQLRNTRKGLGLGNSLPRWRPFLAHDFGVAAPSITYLLLESPGATGPDGKFYPRRSLLAISELATVVDPEDLNRGTGWTVPRLAEEVRAFADRWKVPARGVADDAIFARTGSGAGSIAEEFAKHHVHWAPAHKADRFTGWEIMRRLLSQAGSPDLPGLYISRRCWFAWRTLPFLARDPRNADDLDSRGPDHGADALRYGCLATGEYVASGPATIRLKRVS